MSRLVGLAAGLLIASVVVTSAAATERRIANIEPRERVRGMLVVQGSMTRAQTALLGIYCEPDIITPGRYRRSCRTVPRVRRLFVGYGIWASAERISRAWNASEWRLWIDGQRVSLEEFGTTDRTLYRYPAADGRDVTLREWSVTLVQPTPGRHTIRYRVRHPQGTTDATWEFTVARS